MAEIHATGTSGSHPFPTPDEVSAAIDGLATCVLLAATEKLLDDAESAQQHAALSVSMMRADPSAIPSCPRRPRSSRPSRLPLPASSSCQTAEATNAPSAKSATASHDEPIWARPTTTAAKVTSVAGLTAVSANRLK